MLHSVCQQIWETAVVIRLEQLSFHSNPRERQCQRMVKLLYSFTYEQGNAPNPSGWASAVCETKNPDVQAGFRKGRGTRDQIANIQ